MSEQYNERDLRPAPVLPPPMAPGGYYAAPGSTPDPWLDAPAPSHFPSDLSSPAQPYPAVRDPAAPAPYQQYGYDAYGRPVVPPAAPAWGYGGWPPPPPPRRRSVLGRLLLGLVGLGAAMLFGLIILGAVVGSDAAGTADRTVDHSPAAPDRGSSNPDLPDGPAAVLVDNPLYDQGGLANRSCPAEDLGDASTSEQTRFYEQLMSCLNAAWSAPIERAGFRYAVPGLMVFDSPVNTPCGNATPEDGRRLAFYCPGDSVLYADVPQMRNFFGDVDVAYAILIGHEFGHHVQFETGLLDAYDEAVYDDYDQRLSLSRRVELQASCMGGLFLGSVAETFPVDDNRLSLLEQVAGSFGDAPNAPENRRDHGTGKSNHDWIMGAFRENDIAFCNTFEAPDSAVE